MKKLTYILTLLLVFNVTYLQAYFYKIDIWNNGPKSYFLLSDYHVDHDSCSQQRYDLIKWAKKLDATIIVEDIIVANGKEFFRDPLGYNNNKNYFSRLQLLSFHKAAAPIFGLTSICHYAGIPVVNVEFREAQISSLEGDEISSALVMLLHDKILNEIENYDDSKELNNIYKQILNNYRIKLENKKFLFNYLSKATDSLQRFLKSIISSPKNEETQALAQEISDILKDFGYSNEHNENTHRAHIALKEYLKLFDSPLLDLRLLHHIHNQNSKNIIVAAGGLHIKELNSFFATLGYKKLYSTFEEDWFDKHDKWLSKSPYQIILSPLQPRNVNIDKVFTEETKNLISSLNYSLLSKLNPYFLLFKTKSVIDNCWLSSVFNSQSLNKSVSCCMLMAIGAGLYNLLYAKSFE